MCIYNLIIIKYKIIINYSSNISNSDQAKKKYGALLPKNGVYFLPDDKITSFLKYCSYIIF